MTITLAGRKQDWPMTSRQKHDCGVVGLKLNSVNSRKTCCHKVKNACVTVSDACLQRIFSQIIIVFLISLVRHMCSRQIENDLNENWTSQSKMLSVSQGQSRQKTCLLYFCNLMIIRCWITFIHDPGWKKKWCYCKCWVICLLSFSFSFYSRLSCETAGKHSGTGFQ